MKISLHRPVAFVISAGPLLCGLLPLGGCSKDKVDVSAADATAQAKIASDGGVPCVVGDAPPRSLSDAITPDAILQAMTLTADRQLANPAKWATNLWHYAAFWIGMTKLAPLAESPKYYDAIKKNGDANEWKPAVRPGHADDQAIASSYFYVYSVERDPKVIEPSLARFDEMIKRTFDEPLTWDEVRETPGKNASGSAAIHTREWAWCDALFMAPPAMAEATTSTGDMKYLNLADKLWWKTTDFLYDKNEHLYYRDSRFFEKKEPNGTRVFWSRGNGWVLAGTARMLQNMPEQVSDRGRYLAIFRAMASRIAALQGKDGFWRASLLDPDSVPRPESSGTAFFTYALAWGVNQGILDRATFEPVVHKAWSALTGAVLSSGKLGWVQEVGFSPGETCWDRTEVYGVGAFLLAGSELYRSALLRDMPRITRSFRNPKANARFDEVIEVPLQAEEMKAVASGSKLVAVDGRSGEFLPTQLGDRGNGQLLVRVGSLGPSEERRVHVYRMAAATKLPPLGPHPFGSQAHREKHATVVVEVVGS
jgi:rhamnogalacturonyl hydrolase YesR